MRDKPFQDFDPLACGSYEWLSPKDISVTKTQVEFNLHLDQVHSISVVIYTEFTPKHF